MDIKNGDVVTLKSDGPKMTVVSVSSDPPGSKVIVCKWFRGDVKYRDLQEGKFSPESLVLVNDED